MGDHRAHYSSGPRRGPAPYQQQHGGGRGGGHRQDHKRKREGEQEDDSMRALCYGLFYLGDRKQVRLLAACISRSCRPRQAPRR